MLLAALAKVHVGQAQSTNSGGGAATGAADDVDPDDAGTLALPVGRAVMHVEQVFVALELMTVHVPHTHSSSIILDSLTPTSTGPPASCTSAFAPAMTAWLGIAAPQISHLVADAVLRYVHCWKNGAGTGV